MHLHDKQEATLWREWRLRGIGMNRNLTTANITQLALLRLVHLPPLQNRGQR